MLQFRLHYSTALLPTKTPRPPSDFGNDFHSHSTELASGAVTGHYHTQNKLLPLTTTILMDTPRELAARHTQPPFNSIYKPVSTRGVSASIIALAIVVPLVLLASLVACAFILPRYGKRKRAAQAAEAVTKSSSAEGGTQIYVGQKTELDVIEKDRCELEAVQREVPELTSGPILQEIGSKSVELETAWGIDVQRMLSHNTRHELRGEEFAKELEM